MKDRVIIVGVIVAIHLIVISQFIINSDDSTADSIVDNDTEEVIDIPDSSLVNSSDDEIDLSAEGFRDNLLDGLTTNDAGEQTYVVQPGDSLMVISKKHYGSSKHYNYIYEANKDVLKSASSVRSGQTLVIPPAP